MTQLKTEQSTQEEGGATPCSSPFLVVMRLTRIMIKAFIPGKPSNTTNQKEGGWTRADGQGSKDPLCPVRRSYPLIIRNIRNIRNKARPWISFRGALCGGCGGYSRDTGSAP